MASQDDTDTRPGRFDVTVLLATHPIDPVPSRHVVSLPSSLSTILDLKRTLHDSWDGRPIPQGITVIQGGRVCRDSDRVVDLFSDPRSDPTLHVVVRSTAWSTPFSQPRPVQPPQHPTPVVPAIETTPPSPSPPSPSPPSSSSNLDAQPATPSTLARPETHPVSIGYTPAYVAPVPSSPSPSISSRPNPTSTSPSTTRDPESHTLVDSSTSSSASPPIMDPIVDVDDHGKDEPRPSSTPRGIHRFVPFLGYLHRLIPLQRSLLLLNLQKAHWYYQLEVEKRRDQVARRARRRTRVVDVEGTTEREAGQDDADDDDDEELKEVVELLKECKVWSLVEERERDVRQRVNEDKDKGQCDEGDERRASDDSFRVVELDGLPYLLRTPPSSHRPSTTSISPLASLARAETILDLLTTFLQLVVTFQPTSPLIAHGRAPVRAGASSSLSHVDGSGGGGSGRARGAHLQTGNPEPNAVVVVDPAAVNPFAAAAAAAAAAGPPVPPGGAAAVAARRRAATLSITLHLDALVSLVVPLAYLAFKLAILVVIFGRHASHSKRVVLVLLAVGWVAWEGVVLRRRRRDRERAQQQALLQQQRAQAMAAVVAHMNEPRGGGRRGEDAAVAGEGGGAGGGGERDRRRERRAGAGGGNEPLADRDEGGAERRDGGRGGRNDRDERGNEDRGPGRRGGGAGGGQGGARNARPADAGAGGAAPNAPAPHPPPPTTTTTTTGLRREPPSRLSPKYWINTLAAIGLVDEARELGLSPRYIAGRPIPPIPSSSASASSRSRSSRTSGRSNVPRPTTRYERVKAQVSKGLKRVWIGFVLFFATLSPEVERKRKKALEKRERLLVEKRLRWVSEREREERDREGRGGTGRSHGATTSAPPPPAGEEGRLIEGAQGASTAVEPSRGRSTNASGDQDEDERRDETPALPVLDQEGLRRRRLERLEGPAKHEGANAERDDGAPVGEGRGSFVGGRAKVSDEELFQDGGAESIDVEAMAKVRALSRHDATKEDQAQSNPIASTSTSHPSASTHSPVETDTRVFGYADEAGLGTEDEEEGEGEDVAASASVSSTSSDDEDGGFGGRRPGGHGGGAGGGGAGAGGQDEGGGAVVAIF
ncbi:hypothetical protein JCM10212_000102 [Sporobolomyces blumeae]